MYTKPIQPSPYAYNGTSNNININNMIPSSTYLSPVSAAVLSAVSSWSPAYMNNNNNNINTMNNNTSNTNNSTNTLDMNLDHNRTIHPTYSSYASSTPTINNNNNNTNINNNNLNSNNKNILNVGYNATSLYDSSAKNSTSEL